MEQQLWAKPNKLTYDKAQEIKQEYNKMITDGIEVNKTELANKYGIWVQTLTHLLNGKTFKNPPKPQRDITELREIKCRVLQGDSISVISRAYQIDWSVLYWIKNGKMYKDI